MGGATGEGALSQTAAERAGRRVRWMIFGLALISAAPAPAALAWGLVAHQGVVRGAVESLPKQLKPFYKDHRFEIPSLALEPTIPERGPERRFMVDRLQPFPFLDLPHNEAELKSRYPDLADKVGRLPWLIHESYARLVEAFKTKDKEKILTESDTLAGLVADMHNPLALTENYDGQKTGQHGLWVRFTVKFPEAMEKHLRISPDAAVYLDDPKEYVFSMMNSSYVWADNIQYADDLAKRGKSAYSEIYYESLQIRAAEVLSRRLSIAANDAGSYWYTAWTAAGRPELK
jgi:hypothetical protein